MHFQEGANYYSCFRKPLSVFQSKIYVYPVIEFGEVNERICLPEDTDKKKKNVYRNSFTKVNMFECPYQENR